uniref:probable LRR receptor-like serine/threonine-protein kinase IRK n=1 Tax=Erigeron canadensis TaxID=72917 RepID=UPI001CB8D8A9|nr:probable LRR receptor-like serine/threonine-protein kinase IRK [Erigeron canadensis]
MRAEILPSSATCSCVVVISMYRLFVFGLLLPLLVSAGGCLDDQKSALLSLKNDLTYDALVSTKLVGWNQSTSVECCDWGGVTCDESGHVTQLNLNKEGIRGPIPSYWEGLKYLKYLNLGYNSLDGNIPKSLLMPASSLEDLDLSNNRLSGQIHGLMINVSSSRLRNLDLSSNRLEGPLTEFILKLPATISTLTLSANKFTGRVELDMMVAKFKELYALDLSHNHLTVHAKNSVMMNTSTKLNSLMLASCKMRQIPDVRNQSTLKMLDLSDNELRGEIPNWIWEAGNGYLRFLNLSHNGFSSLQKPYTFPFLLDVLDLHSNMLQGDIPVPPRRVYILDYSNNNFKSAIPVGFGNVLRSTLYFSISNSRVVGLIPQSITRNATSLRFLDLSRNALTGPIDPVIGSMKDLRSLDLSLNMLTGSIPEQLETGLKSLSFLNLSYNHLSGRIPQGSNFQKFTKLSFEGNEGLCGPPLNKTCPHART